MIESSPRVHRHCGRVGAAEVPVFANAGQMVLSWQQKAVMRRWWQGVLRGRDILDRRGASV
jgi:hypothetical protein